MSKPKSSKRPAGAPRTLKASDNPELTNEVLRRVKAPHRPVLVVLNGNELGKRVIVDRSLTIGRDPECDLQLSDGLVSWHHALIEDRGDSWTLIVRRADGSQRTVRPRHLVLATGVSGTEPNMPELPGADEYRGFVCHSSQFPHGVDFSGKKAVVVGTGNSGHDLAQELFDGGAEVTMIQRSPTYVVSLAGSAIAMTGLYEESGPPTDVADLLGASFPFKCAPEMHQATTAAMAEHDKELLADLEKAGFLLTSGINGTGALQLFLQRGGGYYINVGCSELIADGSIGLRSGVEAVRFTSTGLELSDGSTVDADVVVFATGYLGMRETARRLLGDEVADRCGPVWGLDDEGELQGVWRRSGQDGLWFMGGNLAMARFYGKFLALQIKAHEVGLLEPRTTSKGGE